MAIAAVAVAVLGLSLAGWRWRSTSESKTARTNTAADQGLVNDPDSVVEASLDERALQKSCEDVRQRMSQLSSQWCPSASDVDERQWQAAVLGLHQQIDDLGQRIDRSMR